MTVPLLSIRDLSIRFRTKRGLVHAVEKLDLEIGLGETVGLVGESGSGKTVTGRSLIRLLASPPAVYAGGQALFRPRRLCGDCKGAGCVGCDATGKVTDPCRSCTGRGCAQCQQTGLQTADLLGMSDRQMRRVRGNSISMVFQDPGKALNPNLTVRQQVSEVFTEHRSEELLREVGSEEASSRVLQLDAHARANFAIRQALRLPPWRSPHRRLQAVLDDRIAAALTDTRIPNPRQIMQSYPHELSGGMKQRVMIAQALACKPDLLIADEPTTALDVTIQARILDLIAELQVRHQTAVLYISHDLTVVRRISSRVAVMYAGRIMETAPTTDLFADPTHPYTAGLLAAVPSAGQRRGELMAIEGSVPEMVDPTPACRFSSRCQYAAPICRRRDPELIAHGREDHRAACFLLEDADACGCSPEEMPARGVRA